MATNRDRVNRVSGLVYLPIDGSSLTSGQTVKLSNVTEQDIDCSVRDSMEMTSPADGNAMGDAVFDAMAGLDSYSPVMGDTSDDSLFGYEDSDGSVFLIGTGESSATGDVDNACDANEV